MKYSIEQSNNDILPFPIELKDNFADALKLIRHFIPFAELFLIR